ncbi:MAG: hypothetical protein DI570_31610, partial [Phenylobacterium zucineum]
MRSSATEGGRKASDPSSPSGGGAPKARRGPVNDPRHLRRAAARRSGSGHRPRPAPADPRRVR